jgi:GNAT superfamily N-acetyltransferase
MSDRFSTKYGVFHITPKPGLPQVAICHGFYVIETMRSKGYGHKLMEDMVKQLRKDQFDYAICTTAWDNVAMQRCLVDGGWTLLANFHNRKTAQRHQLWTILL